MAAPQLFPIAHEDFVAAMCALGETLRTGDWRPDFIIGVGRGGLAPGVFLSHATGIPMLSVDYSAKVPGFSDEPLVKLAAHAAAGKRLLFVDDINDSGMTIAHLRRSLADAGADMANIRFAVMMDNLRSAERVDYRDRTIDRATDKRWFVFPWEAVAPRAVILEEAEEVPERLA